MMRPLAPLVPASTYRRGVHVLLGGVIALPYALLAAAFVQNARRRRPAARCGAPSPGDRAGRLAVTPALLDGTRAVEVAAARGLLDVDLPDPDRPGCGRRCAPMHVAFGGLVGPALLTAVPMALVMVLRSFGVAGIPLPLVGGLNPVVIGIVGVLLLVVVVCAVAGLGGAAAQVAPAPLGPSRAERIAVLEEQAVRLAERNRLARDVHDPVGHARR
jgi:signal transduction histidine kinase